MTGQDYRTPAGALAAAIEEAAARLDTRATHQEGMRLVEARFGRRAVGDRGYYYQLVLGLVIENGKAREGDKGALWKRSIVAAWEGEFEVTSRQGGGE